jgi:hypothetical protein
VNINITAATTSVLAAQWFGVEFGRSESVRFRPPPPTPNELSFSELQNPEEASASEIASEIKTGALRIENPGSTRQPLEMT